MNICNISNIREILKKDTSECVIIAVFVSFNCKSCECLVQTFKKSLENNAYSLKFKTIIFPVVNLKKVLEAGVNIRVTPTVLAYKNNKLRLGWEGFAALAPDEIKREMVEDVLRQVAALADEDDGGGLPQEIPPQVRDDN